MWKSETAFTIGCSILSFFGKFRIVHDSSSAMGVVRLFYNLVCATCTGPKDDIASISRHYIVVAGRKMQIRIYRGANSDVLPAIIFFHGGAFSVGGFRSHEALVRKLAKQLSCAVVVCDYRLAPENSYPSAADDAYATIEWTAANAKALGIDPEKLILSGDSAGGTIAAVAARWLRDRNGPKVALQLLLYPMTDAALGSESWQQFPNGPALNRGIIEAAWSRYSPNLAQRLSADVSPLSATDLRGLPPTIIITADRDPLRDEGIAYGDALKSQGVEVTQLNYPGTVHAFLQVPESEHGRAAMCDIKRLATAIFAERTPVSASSRLS